MNNIYISQSAQKELVHYLESTGSAVHFVPPQSRTYPAVDSHADIFFCRMGTTKHTHIFSGDPAEIGSSYPDNIKFNAVCLDSYFIHNIKYTSPTLLHEAREIGLALINVKQGYTKCNCVAVDGHSLITADNGIYNMLKSRHDIDVLKIRQGFVNLDGFAYGFLGGASGRVGNEVIFNGDLSSHPDCEAIAEFISSRGLSVRYFKEYPLTDIGSILADY